MKLPLVSIITPVSQTNFLYVGECVSSVARQTYPTENLELLLSMDSSDRRYHEKLENIVGNNQIEVRVISYNKNGDGPSMARNRAISSCHGDWVLILDSDDVIETTAVESMVNSIRSDTVMVYSDHARVSHDLQSVRYVRQKALYHKLVGEYINSPIHNPLYSSVYISHGELIRKDAFEKIGGYKKEIGEKPPVWIELFEMFGYNSLVHVPHILYYYRENKAGIAAQRKQKLIMTHEETFLEFIQKYNDSISEAKYIGRICPFMVKHFAFFDKLGEFIRMPYIDYNRKKLLTPFR